MRKFITISFIIEIYILLFPFIIQGQNTYPNPVIKVGTANISGNINTDYFPDAIKSIMIQVITYSPITGKNSFKILVNQNKSFNLNIPLECSTAIAGLNLYINEEYHSSCNIGLSQTKRLKINIVIDNSGNMNINAIGGLELTANEMTNIIKSSMAFDNHYTWGEYYRMTPEEFLEYELNTNLKERMKIAMDTLNLPNRTITYLTNTFNLLYISGRLFHYKESAEESFKRAKANDTITYTAIEPNKKYYSFMKKLDLNNPQYLYSYSYSDFLKSFLNIKAFSISEIKNTPIDIWVTEVKKKIKNIIGFDSGLFYDMLIANAYELQLSSKNDSLTKLQIKNIETYYKTKNKEIINILLNKNDELKIKLENSRNLKINEVPTAAEGNIIDSIIHKYKGKVVLVDFWATWCSPCQDAMKDLEVLKKSLEGRNIIFVYITDESSAKKTWENQIKVIGGEHYYLTKEEWNSIMGRFNFSYIPAYLIYAPDGVLKSKFDYFPGINLICKIINELL